LLSGKLQRHLSQDYNARNSAKGTLFTITGKFVSKTIKKNASKELVLNVHNKVGILYNPEHAAWVDITTNFTYNNYAIASPMAVVMLF